jgi:hypothetical protein
MVRSVGFALLLGLVAAPVSFEGAQEAQAQKEKKIITKKTKKVAGPVKAGPTRKVGAGKAAVLGAAAGGAIVVGKNAKGQDENKVLYVKRGLRNTNLVLRDARQAVKAGAKGADLLRSAVIRQHAARKASAANQPRQAFYLTRAARSLAREAIALNGLKVEIPKGEDTYMPTPEDMAGVDVFINDVETNGQVPTVENIANEESIGTDLPEDLGEDAGVMADPNRGPEVEVEQN